MIVGRVTLEWARMSDLSQNSRLHWSKKHRLVKAQRIMAHEASLEARLHLARKHIPAEGDIRITYICCPPSGTAYPDDDNFIAAQKGARDAIAAVLRVDDSRFRNQPVVKGDRSKEGGVIVLIEVDSE